MSVELIAKHEGKDGWVEGNKEYNSKRQVPIRFGEAFLESSDGEKMSLTIFYHSNDYYMECFKERKEFGNMNYDVYFYKGDLRSLIKEYLRISNQSKSLLKRYLNKFKKAV